MSTLAAGRELDREIAEKVMGWTLTAPVDPTCTHAVGTNRDGSSARRNFVRAPGRLSDEVLPDFSTSIADALSVAEHLRKTKGLGYVIGTNGMALQQNGVKFFEGFHGAGHSIFDAEPHPGWYRVAETIPLALCRAALAYAESRRPAPQTE